MKTPLHLTVVATVLVAMNLSAATLYVSLDSPNPTPPYTNWATAAHVIQEAVDAASDGDTVLVTNGVYAVGSRETSMQEEWGISTNLSRVVLTNSIWLKSVNGPQFTVIEGAKFDWETGEGADIRCAYVGNDAILSGFTLRNGASRWGAGVFCEGFGLVTNCSITGNSGWSAGGAYGGTLHGCTLSSNSVHANHGGGAGGGAYGSTLCHCTLVGNTAFAAPDSPTRPWRGSLLEHTLPLHSDT